MLVGHEIMVKLRHPDGSRWIGRFHNRRSGPNTVVPAILITIELPGDDPLERSRDYKTDEEARRALDELASELRAEGYVVDGGTSETAVRPPEPQKIAQSLFDSYWEGDGQLNELRMTWLARLDRDAAELGLSEPELLAELCLRYLACGGRSSHSEYFASLQNRPWFVRTLRAVKAVFRDPYADVLREALAATCTAGLGSVEEGPDGELRSITLAPSERFLEKPIENLLRRFDARLSKLIRKTLPEKAVMEFLRQHRDAVLAPERT